MAMLRVGAHAPDIEATDQAGEVFSLAETLSARAVVVFFYPKNGTPVCTREACAFRDAYDTFAAHGAEVVGISADPVASHQTFASTHNLPFRLLSDPDGTLRKAFGVTGLLGLLPGRITYVIDQTQTIRMAFSSQLHAKQHVEEALRIVKEIQSTL